MGYKIKAGLGLILLSMLVFTACGNKDKVNTINEINNAVNATEPNADVIAPSSLEDNDGIAKLSFGAEPDITEDIASRIFRKGTWFLSQGDTGVAYMSFYEDGKTGIRYNLNSGDEQSYTYNLEETILTINFNGYEESIVSENMEQLDEDTVKLDVRNDEPYVLTYVSENFLEEFKFYSADELFELARSYYEKKENREVESVAIRSNANMTVTVELGDKNSDAIVASYTVSTLSAEGIDDFTGENVDLKE